LLSSVPLRALLFRRDNQLRVGTDWCVPEGEGWKASNPSP